MCYSLRRKVAFVDTLVYYTDLPKMLELPDPASKNPYHVLFDMIARFYYFDSGCNEILYYFPKKGYLIETILSALPPRFKRETEKREGYEYLDFPGIAEYNGILQHSWPYEYVKGLLTPLWQNIQQEKDKFVYISRAYPKNKCRGVTNEEEVINTLRPLGFSTYTLEYMSVKDTIHLFRSARIIVASHGAGLAWSLFCHPGTIIVEIYPDNTTKLYYHCLAQNMQLEFYRFKDVIKDLSIPVNIPENVNYSINSKSLEHAIRKLLKKIDVS